MNFSLENRTVSLSVGEFAGFTLGPSDSGGGSQGIWRAQLGQHWHNDLQKRTLAESPAAQFEVVIDGRITHRGWTFALSGRIDQLLPESPLEEGGPPGRGVLLREIKSVMRPLPAEETDLRTDYPAYFLQLAAYTVLVRASASGSALPAPRSKLVRAELVFVEAGSGLAQTIALTPFDEALVHHQLDALVEFLNLRLRATERRRALTFHPAFPSLRAGQETIQQNLSSALRPPLAAPKLSSGESEGGASVVLFEAPTGYGKTGCVLEFALGQMKAGRFARLIWLTGKSTGQLQVVHTLQQMTGGTGPLDRFSATPAEPTRPEAGFHPLAFWQVRNKSEHCINHTFHCVRDGCDFLKDCAERWPDSGLAKFYLDDRQPRDLATLRAAGREARICPYEITRASLAFNDVWIGDFNYVFAPDNRGLFFDQPGFDPAETLLVIDEAHNLPSRVAGAHSHRATDTDARLLLAELDHLQAPATLVLALEEWTRLLASLRPADSLDPAIEAEVHDHVAKLANLVSTQPLDYAALGPKHAETLWSFGQLAEFLDDAKLTKLLWVAREGELEFTCVDAAPAIGEILKTFGGAILMSATLQPYPEFAASCGLVGRVVPDEPRLTETVRPTYATLHAPTPWRAGAYDVAVDLRVSTTFRERSTYYGTTAATVEELHRASSLQVSGLRSQVSTATAAVAVFFPSYAYAEAVLRALEQNGSVLRVALQPKLPDLTAQTAWIEENVALSDALFLVLGSSFAEGIDLLGGRVSHAMVVGPALPEVNAVQKARMDALAGLGREASFRRVYQIPGLQKVNQAVGRLVRAPGQHAKMLLHCRRFAEPSYAALLAADYQMFKEIASESDLREWLDGTG
ncbi:helicase C-terminal domain-containing protein [Opitutus sp. GAS368]|uniref:ATP-dependent DNA helicase n=1 Tax=Opitutus sp. GAS368 TaxID=1882749 RepID=UPI00087C00DE|nr:helicase C-terminal domain-containing protein [Opitutus sp. GAS368]SDR67751.1 Rad3-related DNA helicase [Opitutus sp. GAS368]